MEKNYKKITNVVLELALCICLIAAGYMIYPVFNDSDFAITGIVEDNPEQDMINGTNVDYILKSNMIASGGEIKFTSLEKLESGSMYTVYFEKNKNGMSYTCHKITKVL